MGLFVCRSCGIRPGRFFREIYAKPAARSPYSSQWLGGYPALDPRLVAAHHDLVALLASRFCPIVFALGLTTETDRLLEWARPMDRR